MSDKAVTLAGRYALETTVARGGMATVWEAQDRVLARRVAVKVLHPHLAKDAAFLERFRREALAAAGLTHPNIVAIYDSGSEEVEGQGELHYIVMEYCGGGTLAEVLRRESTLAPERAIGIAGAICEALDYAHAHEVIHRDVKPANVLIADDGSLKVADFGIAKAAFTAHDLTTTGSILGTVTYLSPEQAKGAEPDARSDLYGLGVVLYESLVGRPPFVADSQLAVAMKHINEPPPSLRSIKAGIPRSLEAVVMRSLEKSPDARFSSAAEMKAMLEAPGGRGTSSASSVLKHVQRPTVGEATGQPSGDLRSILLVLGIVAIAVVAAIFLSRIDGGTDETSSGNGNRSGNSNAGAPLTIANASDFDPHGDGGSEHPEDVGLAIDGDDSTAWHTENYNDALQLIKPGVGLLFDLGEEAHVTSVEVSATPGTEIEVRAADVAGASEDDFDTVDSAVDTSGTTRFEVDDDARYWLVWITSLPGGGGGSAQIFEVTFSGG